MFYEEYLDNLTLFDSYDDDEDEEALEAERLEAERVKQLKADRLKLIKRAARKLQGNTPESFKPTLIATLADSITPKKKSYQKLPASFNEASVEDLEPVFIMSLLYNLSTIKPKRTLTLKQPRPTTGRFPMYTYKDVLEELQPKRKLLDENFCLKYQKRLQYYTQRISLKNSFHHLQLVGYYPCPASPNGLMKGFAFIAPDKFDSTLLYLMMEEYNRTVADGMFIRVKGRYLLSIKAMRWMEQQLNGGDL